MALVKIDPLKRKVAIPWYIIESGYKMADKLFDLYLCVIGDVAINQKNKKNLNYDYFVPYTAMVKANIYKNEKTAKVGMQNIARKSTIGTIWLYVLWFKDRADGGYSDRAEYPLFTLEVLADGVVFHFEKSTFNLLVKRLKTDTKPLVFVDMQQVIQLRALETKLLYLMITMFKNSKLRKKDQWEDFVTHLWTNTKTKNSGRVCVLTDILDKSIAEIYKVSELKCSYTLKYGAKSKQHPSHIIFMIHTNKTKTTTVNSKKSKVESKDVSTLELDTEIEVTQSDEYLNTFFDTLTQKSTEKPKTDNDEGTTEEETYIFDI